MASNTSTFIEMDVRGKGRIQDCSKFIELLQLGELGDVGIPDVAAQGEAGDAAFAGDVD